jgi:hypothetical protein
MNRMKERMERRVREPTPMRILARVLKFDCR